ncbi:hypothetical protein POVWA2_007840 [Plasmodium ovale wallikeri]|uniref:Uncharacterized protein n=1 Tax=Plasmodium ovale wallikeri TaxID=864142 RepID=A0A1A8YL68_PLAOA|nr:hypothetical protein POVWA1_007670 [Plasmodium ovale wallikeri]SBT32111.1 hypothetical protein POVWA2_007840 [Plasmodium ovale wallikeri]
MKRYIDHDEVKTKQGKKSQARNKKVGICVYTNKRMRDKVYLFKKKEKHQKWARKCRKICGLHYMQKDSCTDHASNFKLKKKKEKRKKEGYEIGEILVGPLAAVLLYEAEERKV